MDITKIKDYKDIAKLLRVELDVPTTEVCAGNEFEVKIKVTLADGKEQSNELLEIIEANRDWFGVVDIRDKDGEYINVQHPFNYAKHEEIFEDGVYRGEEKIKAPQDKSKLTLVGRIRTEKCPNDSPWEGLYTDSKEVTILKLS